MFGWAFLVLPEKLELVDEVTVEYLIELGDFYSLSGEDLLKIEYVILKMCISQRAYEKKRLRTGNEVEGARGVVDQVNLEVVWILLVAKAVEVNGGQFIAESRGGPEMALKAEFVHVHVS